MLNIIIIGAQDTENYEFVRQKLISVLKPVSERGEGITILTTGDEFIDKFTERYKIDKYFFPTEWGKYGKDALKYRNEKIVEKANAIFFFENNKKDSQILYKYAKDKGLTSRFCIPPSTKA